MGIKVLKRIAGLDFDNLVQSALTKNKEEIAEISRGQLDRGETPSGGPLPVYRNKAYVRRKRTTPKTAPGGRFNLRNTGKFHKGITPKVSKTAITFPKSQQEQKYPKLVKYSDTGTLLTWNKKSIMEAQEAFLIEAIIKEFKNIVFA